MSFYIRKSVRFGPVRLNLSKSGVGVSFGVRGARLSTGPRGTYINMGSHGVYYRQKINDLIDSPTTSQSYDFEGDDFRKTEQPQVNVGNLVESSSKELLDKMNSRIHQPRYAFLIGVITTIIAGGIALFGLVAQNFQTAIHFVWIFFFGIAGLIWLLGLWVAWITSQQEKYAQITTLRYSLDESATKRFATLQNSLEDLSRSNRIWLLTSKISTFDWKRNAGASSLISRRPVVIRQKQPPFVTTQIRTFTLSSNLFQLFFMPDQILIFQNGKYGAVNYQSLIIDEVFARFIEDEAAPQDSNVVDTTWQYVRRDGGPDLRFKNNRKLPIMRYGYIEISSLNGLQLRFYISNAEYAKQFAHTLINYSAYSKRFS